MSTAEILILGNDRFEFVLSRQSYPVSPSINYRVWLILHYLARHYIKRYKSFNEVFLEYRTESLRRSLESSPVAMAVQELANDRKEYNGTIKQLKATLDESYHQQGEGWPKSPRGLSEALRRTAPALREIGIEIEFLGHQRDGAHISIKRFLLSKNNDHTVTDQAKTKEIQGFCDGVTVVTDDSGKPEKPNGDIPGRSDYSAVKYGE